MLLEQRQNNVLTNIISDQSKFTIRASSKAFSILSDSLYSDKIMAIIREISSNAYDAHVAANKPYVPFKVTLPTTLEPSFKIRDYGLGLSKHDITTLYTSYFFSNKTHSNDFVGAMGLGSKSPFAYTNMFNITSYHQGEKHDFVAFIGEDNIPEIRHMNTQDHDPSDTGLEISMLVEKKDYNDFLTKAKLVYVPYRVKPIINQDDVYFSTNSWWVGTQFEILRVNDASNYYIKSYLRGKVFVEQGQVLYPIDVEVKHLKPKSNNYCLIIHADIGEFDITPSREALSVTEKTKASIKRYDEQFHALMEKEKTRIEIDSNFDVQKLCHDLTPLFAFGVVKSGPFYRGNKFYHDMVEVYDRTSFCLKEIDDHMIAWFGQDSQSYGGNYRLSDQTFHLHLNTKKMLLIVKDVDTKLPAMKHIVEEYNNAYSRYVIIDDTFKGQSMFGIEYDQTTVSEVIKKVRGTVQRVARAKRKPIKWGQYVSRNNAQDINKTNIDLGGRYIVVEQIDRKANPNYKVKGGERHITEEWIMYLCKLDKCAIIYEKYKDKFEASDKWTEIDFKKECLVPWFHQYYVNAMDTHMSVIPDHVRKVLGIKDTSTYLYAGDGINAFKSFFTAKELKSIHVEVFEEARKPLEKFPLFQHVFDKLHNAGGYANKREIEKWVSRKLLNKYMKGEQL